MHHLRLLFLCGALVAATVPCAVLAAQPAATAKAPPPTDTQPALDALQQLLSAHAAGNHKKTESLVDPAMLGYSRVIDPVRGATVAQRQLRISLSDARTQVSEDVVIIQVHWEKRFVSSPGRQAGRKSGACTFVMRPDATVWKLSALNGDNPFGAE